MMNATEPWAKNTPETSLGRCMLYPLKPSVSAVFYSSPLSLPKLVCYWTLLTYPCQSGLWNMPSISAAQYVVSHQGSSCFRARQRTSIRKGIKQLRFPSRSMSAFSFPYIIGALCSSTLVCYISDPDGHLQHCGLLIIVPSTTSGVLEYAKRKRTAYLSQLKPYGERHPPVTLHKWRWWVVRR
ncbi:hypothetical protein BC826DRAFT_200629 [Russula brevipes]|nr:hypothetical protein BC826DRAFT_200629 [Russula brevipes]